MSASDPADEMMFAAEDYNLVQAIASFAYGEEFAKRYAARWGESIERAAKRGVEQRRKELLRPSTSGLPGSEVLKPRSVGDVTQEVERHRPIWLADMRAGEVPFDDEGKPEGFDQWVSRRWDTRRQRLYADQLHQWVSADTAKWTVATKRLLGELRAGSWRAINGKGKRVTKKFWEDHDLNTQTVICYRYRKQAVSLQHAPAPMVAPARRRHNGLDHRSKDAPLVDQMHELIVADEANSAEDAARALVGAAVGKGDDASKVKRLTKRYHEKYPKQD